MLLEQRLVHGAQQNKDTDQDDDPGDGAGQDIDGCFHQGITGHDGVCAAEVGLADDAQNQTEDHGRAVELAGGEDEADEAGDGHQSIRKELIENHQLRAVISMPSGVFKPYAGVSTAVLVFTKTGAGGTDKVWFYDMKADGFSLDDKRTEVKENDIPDIIARFHNLDAETDRKRTEQSFFVPKEEIAANGYDLSINKYKETEYVPVEYPSTTEILADLHELEMEITKGLAELEEMV